MCTLREYEARLRGKVEVALQDALKAAKRCVTLPCIRGELAIALSAKGLGPPPSQGQGTRKMEGQ